jgi:hypothetical protein
MLPIMDQRRAHAALGSDPIRTIGRAELKARLERGDDFKLIMALNRWAFDAKHIPGSLHFDTPDELYAAVRPDNDVVVCCRRVRADEGAEMNERLVEVPLVEVEHDA